MEHSSASVLAQEHLDHLVEDIGPRMIGSGGNRAAAAYVEEVFTRSGLSVRRQPYPCLSWSATRCELRIDGRRLDATPNTFSPPGEISAAFVVIRTLAELEDADVAGRVLVLAGEVTKNGIMPLREQAVYLPDRDRRIGALVRQKQPAALVTVSLAREYWPPVIEDPGLDIPSLTVPPEVGLAIAGAPDAQLAVTIDSTTTEGETCNVIGMKLGPTGRVRVLLCAHYDTKYETPGAWDNGSGVAALLTLAEICAVEDPRVSLEFVAFSAEEYSANTDSAGGGDPYLSEYGLSIPPFVFGQESRPGNTATDLDNVLFVMNFDGVGNLLTPNTAAMMASSSTLKALVRAVLQEFPKVVEVGPWPASNHYAFYSNGVPSIALGSGEMRNIIHTPADTAKWVSGERIAETVALAQRLVDAVSDKSPDWCRRDEPVSDPVRGAG